MLNELDPTENEFEINDNDLELKEDILEAELLIQDELDEEFENSINIDDIDFDEKEVIDNSINFDDDAESELDVYFKYGTNNHKLDGKHSLKRDTILNGKLNEPNDLSLDIYSHGIAEFEMYDNSGEIPLERGSLFEEESRNAEDLQMKRKLAEDVYYLLENNTDLDFRSNRRKPNKATFNNYYKMLLTNIDSQYTKNEIFVELAYYFTDNIFNMFKLLDKKYAIGIIKELKEKGHLKNIDNLNFS